MPKINALPPQNSPAGDDVFPTDDVSDGNTTKKLTLTKLKEWLQSLVGWITTAMLADTSVTASKIDFTTLRLGKAVITSDATSTSAVATPSAVSGLSVTFTLTQTRTVRATLTAPSTYNSGATGYNRLTMWNGAVNSGSIIAVQNSSFTSTSQEMPVCVVADRELTAGTYTFNIGLGRNSGTATLSASSAGQAVLTVDLVS